MTKELINYDLSKEEINTLVQAGIIPDRTPVGQIAVFARICKEKGLSPFSKEIYLVEYAGRYSCIVGINGFRKIAAETGQLAGCDDAKFNLQSNGTFNTASELQDAGKLPTSATVTVYRIVGGIRVAFTHTALFKEFSTGKQKWQSMPFQMIEKVAEAFALRKGFGDRLTGLHVEEEKGALQDSTIAKSNAPAVVVDEDALKNAIADCWTNDDLKALYQKSPGYAEYADWFTERKNEIATLVQNGQIPV